MPLQDIKNYANFGARAMALAIDFVLLAATQIFLFFILADWLFNEVLHLEALAILVPFSSCALPIWLYSL
jgi:hypothetical protein